MKQLVHLLCAVIVLVSCSEKEPRQPEKTTHDGKSFCIALIPIAECLPLYYAAEREMDKKLGFPLDIHSYMSQGEASAALADSCDAGFACSKSAEQLMSSGKYNKLLILSGQWKLLASPTSRIRKIVDLADRVVAIAPGTLTDKLAKDAATKAGLSGEAVMYPHVISYSTAASMLIFNQVDATVLPEPYASHAIDKRAISIATLAEDTTGYLLIKSTRKSNLADSVVKEKLQKIYNIAADSLNHADKETIEKLYQTACNISPSESKTKQIVFKKAK